MSEASFQRSGQFAPPLRTITARPLQRGYGLLIGAGVSLSLWGVIAWGVARLFA